MSRRIDREEAAHLQYETEHTQPPKSRSVVVYMAVLIGAAFLLLLLAYFMQVRTASTVEGLHQSVNSFQTIDQLVEDNRLLQEEVAQLKEENAELESRLATAEKEFQNSLLALEEGVAFSQKQTAALNCLNQLRVLYNRGRYKDAIALIQDNPGLEGALKEIDHDLLPDQLELYDPLAAYQRIAKLLGVE